MTAAVQIIYLLVVMWPSWNPVSLTIIFLVFKFLYYNNGRFPVFTIDDEKKAASNPSNGIRTYIEYLGMTFVKDYYTNETLVPTFIAEVETYIADKSLDNVYIINLLPTDNANYTLFFNEISQTLKDKAVIASFEYLKINDAATTAGMEGTFFVSTYIEEFATEAEINQELLNNVTAVNDDGFTPLHLVSSMDEYVFSLTNILMDLSQRIQSESSDALSFFGFERMVIVINQI